MTNKTFLLLIVGGLFFFSCVARAGAQHYGPDLAPRIDMSIYRRSYTPDETIPLSVSVFNSVIAHFDAYKLNLDTFATNSRFMDDFGPTLSRVNLSGKERVTSWSYHVKYPRPDTWAQMEVDCPKLAPGIYVVEARTATGSTARRWFMVTNIALVVKRSAQQTMIYSTDATTGKPVPDTVYRVVDEKGTKAVERGDDKGIARFTVAPFHGMLWISGENNDNPYVATSDPVGKLDPYTVFSCTDRPIYRPGQTVRFRSAIRSRSEADEPGGFHYGVYARQPVVVEVRDATDALISSKRLATDASGTFADQLKLSSEPVLGRWQIVMRIGTWTAYSEFQVQDFRKPEFTVTATIPKAHYLNGETVPVNVHAAYFFGGPVPHATVKLHIVALGVDDVQSVTTDINGNAVVNAETQKVDEDSTLNVTANVTDLSRRTESASASTALTAALFTMSLSMGYQYHPGETITGTISTRDYDGNPVSTDVRVLWTESRVDAKFHTYDIVTHVIVHTDKNGQATVTLPVKQLENVSVVATGYDGDDHRIRANGSANVVPYNKQEAIEMAASAPLSVSADTPSCTSGSVLRLHLTSSYLTFRVAAKEGERGEPLYKDLWAVMTIEGERLYGVRMVHLTGASTEVDVPIAADMFPGVQINFAMVLKKQLYEQDAAISVDPGSRHLTVSIVPDKAAYNPGDTATYSVKVEDPAGKPVATELGLGVVDASIYQIAPDSTPDPYDVFYAQQQVRIASMFSFAAQYSGGAYQTRPNDTAGAPGAAANTIRVRRNFADTAYWDAFVQTGADGVGKVSFRVPDNLTSWRTTARAISPDTQCGASTNDVISSLPFQVRLELPRFTVKDDDGVLSAIVRNDSGVTRPITAHLDTTGCTATDAVDRSLTLATGEQQRLDWHVHVTSPDSVFIRVTADGGDGARDAMEMTLPSHPDGRPDVKVDAAVVSAESQTTRVDLSTLPANATLTLTLAPSVGASMFDALDYLVSYPYACAEQTTSAMIPNLAVQRALDRLKSTKTVPVNLDEFASIALQKLYRYQHTDGGWHWWENDASDPDMTAYVLSGMIQARDNGITVDTQRIQRGVNYLLGVLNEEREPSLRADYLLPISFADSSSAAGPLSDLYDKRSELDCFGLASLCLGLAQCGGKDGALAVKVADQLEAKVNHVSRLAWWTLGSNDFDWRGGKVVVTAHVLRALEEVKPNSVLILPAVTWLMANRNQDGAWNSTRDSAEAILALTTYMERIGELHPNFVSTVSLDDVAVKTLTADSQTVFDKPMTVTLTPNMLAGHKIVSVSKEGPGALYLTSIANYVNEADTTLVDAGFVVTRSFTITADDPLTANTLDSGSTVTVTVQIQAEHNYKYVVIEDPVPSGSEIVSDYDQSQSYPLDYWDRAPGFVRQEARDDRVAFFFDELPKGMTRLTYQLHTETPGTYHILPSLAYLNYFPDVRGTGPLVMMRTGEGK